MSTQVIINDVIPKTQITATAGQTVFTTNWTANAASDVVVYARTSAQTPDDLTQLVSSANYAVAFVGGSEIVEVTFLVGRALNDVVTITRDTPADRLNLYTNTNFTPSMLNQDVGILTLVDQQAQLYNERVAPHYNVSATPDLGDPITGVGGDIYLPVLGANQTWKKNSSNTAITTTTFPSGGGLAPSDATYIVQTPYSPGGELPNQQALSTLATGFMSSVTGTGVVSTRTLQGTANQINVTNGTGTGNPVFSLSSALQLPGTMTFGGNVDANGYNIANIGFITGGTWQGNTIGVAYGGTGNTSVGANGTLAQSDGTKYTFTTATYPTTTTVNRILFSSATNVVGEIGSANSATLVTNSTGVPAFTGSMSNGQLVIGSTGATPVVGSITGAGSITVTNGAGTIQISSSAGGVVNAGTINELAYYAATGSVVSGLATANDGVLITSAGGAPSISSTLPAAVQSNISNVVLTTGTITTIPGSANDITNKAYVDSVAQGLSVKASALYGTTANIALSGLGAQAGGEWTGSLTAGDRILVKNQTATADNGIYSADAAGWTRTADANTWDELVSAFLFVQLGATLADTSWVCTIDQGGTLGVTPVYWVQFSGAGTYTAGTGLTLAGNQFSITNTAVTAASYGGASSVPTFTVNAQGQLTAASDVAVVAPAGTLSGTILAANVVSSSLTSVGTLTGGTWNANTITVPYGGTGITTATAYAVLCGGTTSTGAFQSVASVGTAGQVLTSNGASALPSFQNATGGADAAFSLMLMGG